MAQEITVPRLGWDMTKGTFVSWLKQQGDPIQVGDSLFTLEGDKATEEIESMDRGVLYIPEDGPQPGDVLEVGTVIGFVLSRGESPPTLETAVSKKATITPRARRVAKELGVEWHSISGSGKKGRIREADIRAVASDRRSQAQAPGPRDAIARRMRASVEATAPVTLTTTADATNLVELRQQFVQQADEPVPSWTDFLVRFVALALREHPHLNAQWQGNGIRLLEEVHMGLAVDTDHGLLVPVLRNVQEATLREIAAQSNELIRRAKERKLRTAEMEGGTFTISNLGMYGIETFTPIIQLPQCAILGVGTIEQRPAVVEGEIQARWQLSLSLTVDHRVVDGAPAARFLQRLRQMIEQPGPPLIR